MSERPVLVYVNYADISASRGNSINERGFVREFLEIEDFDTRYLGCTTAEPMPYLAPHMDRIRLRPLKKTIGSQIGFQFWLFKELRRIKRESGDNCVVCCRPHYFSFAPVLTRRLLGLPLISKEAGLGVEIYKKHHAMGKTRRWLSSWARRLHGKTADRVWCVTEPIRQFWIQQQGVSPEKAFVVGNGSDVSMFRPDVPPKLPDGVTLPRRWKWALLYAGHLNQQVSGLDALVTAVSTLAKEGYDLGLIVAGDGEQREALEQLVENEGLTERVVLAGWLPYQSMPGLYAYCDILTALLGRQFLRTHGSSSQKVFQSVAIGKPLIAGAAADHDFIAENGFGRLVDPEDPAEIAANLREMMQGEPVTERSSAGYDYVSTVCSYKAIARQIADVAKGLLPAGSSGRANG